MQYKDTPPPSPHTEMDISEDDEDIFEEDLEEIIELPENDHMSDSEDDEAGAPRDDSSVVFTEHKGAVFGCDLEPVNESVAVSGGQDDKGFVWDVNTGAVVMICSDHKDSVTSVGFNHDGTYVASGDMSGYIQVWKLSTKSKVWDAEIGDMTWMRWHHAANVLLAASATGDVYIWKIPGGECKVLPSHGGRSECGVVLTDGRRLAVGCDYGSVNVFDMKSSAVLHHVSPNQEPDSIYSLDSHSDNNLLLYGAEKSIAYMMKTQTGQVVCRFVCDDDPDTSHGVETVGFCKDPSIPWAATGTLGGVLTIWDISKQARRHVHKQREGFTKLLWMNNNLILTGCTGGTIRLFDSRSGNMEREFCGHSADIYDLVVSSDNLRILSSSDDKTVRIFNIATPNG